ncbi:MAG: PAS domain S-box protein [Chloroflexi bacterium]|nr:PAS domain S-box protein [Chloroflexota bacterium]
MISRADGAGTKNEPESCCRILFESSPDAMVLIQPSLTKAPWTIVKCNEAFCSLNGYAMEELIGQSIDRLNKGVSNPDVREQYLARLRREGKVKVDWTHQRKDGTILSIESYMTLVNVGGQELVLGIDRDMSDRTRMEQALAEERQMLRTLIDSLPDYIYVKDMEGRFVITNAANAWVMRAPDPDAAIGKSDFDYYPEDEAAAYRAAEQSVIRTGQPVVNREEVSTDPIGNARWTLTTKVPRRDSRGDVIGILGVGRDITERKRVEQALVESESRLKTILEKIPTGIMIVDPETHTIVDVNRVAASWIGAAREQIVGSVCHQYVCPAERGHCPITDLGQTVDNAERVLLTAEGQNLPVIKTVTTVMLGGRPHLLESLTDITERKRAEEQLKFISTHDTLTGLYNRCYFEEEQTRLDHSRQFPVSVIMADVDGLKAVNDEFGHAAGDELLKSAAAVLSACFRPEDVVARIGGDEFSVLLAATDSASAEKACERIRENVHRSNLTGQKAVLRLSIGMATADATGGLARALKESDDRMYRNKIANRRPEQKQTVSVK